MRGISGSEGLLWLDKTIINLDASNLEKVLLTNRSKAFEVHP